MDNPGTFFIEEFDPAVWMNFISSQPEAHPFHHPEWISFLAACYGYRPYLGLVRDRSGAITAGLPFMQTGSFPGRRKWISLPFSDHCRPLFETEEDLSALTEGLLARSRSRKIDRLELKWEYPSRELSRHTGHVLTSTPLDADPEEIRKRIKGNDFRKVRLGTRREIESIRSTSLEAMRTYFRLHLESRRRLGVPSQPWRFFRLLSERIIAKGMGFVSLARAGGEYLAGIVFIYWNNTLVYKFAASSSRGRQLAASYPITWDAVTWASQNGFRQLDWGRSDLEDQGLRDFKKRWASEEVELAYSSNRPDTASLVDRVNPVMRQFIRRSPIWVCRLSGELFYRYFG